MLPSKIIQHDQFVGGASDGLGRHISLEGRIDLYRLG